MGRVDIFHPYNVRGSTVNSPKKRLLRRRVVLASCTHLPKPHSIAVAKVLF